MIGTIFFSDRVLYATVNALLLIWAVVKCLDFGELSKLSMPDVTPYSQGPLIAMINVVF